jgi:hypothetical protein
MFLGMAFATYLPCLWLRSRYFTAFNLYVEADYTSHLMVSLVCGRGRRLSRSHVVILTRLFFIETYNTQ